LASFRDCFVMPLSFILTNISSSRWSLISKLLSKFYLNFFGCFASRPLNRQINDHSENPFSLCNAARNRELEIRKLTLCSENTKLYGQSLFTNIVNDYNLENRKRTNSRFKSVCSVFIIWCQKISIGLVFWLIDQMLVEIDLIAITDSNKLLSVLVITVS